MWQSILGVLPPRRTATARVLMVVLIGWLSGPMFAGEVVLDLSVALRGGSGSNADIEGPGKSYSISAWTRLSSDDTVPPLYLEADLEQGSGELRGLKENKVWTVKVIRKSTDPSSGQPTTEEMRFSLPPSIKRRYTVPEGFELPLVASTALDESATYTSLRLFFKSDSSLLMVYGAED